MTRNFPEEIVTDRLTEKDWDVLLALNLKAVHKAYLEEFKRRNNEPTLLSDIWSSVGWRPSISDNVAIGQKQKMVFFDQVSSALKIRKTPYRLRAISQNPQGSKFRVVRVAPKQLDLPLS